MFTFGKPFFPNYEIIIQMLNSVQRTQAQISQFRKLFKHANEDLRGIIFEQMQDGTPKNYRIDNR